MLGIYVRGLGQATLGGLEHERTVGCLKAIDGPFQVRSHRPQIGNVTGSCNNGCASVSYMNKSEALDDTQQGV